MELRAWAYSGVGSPNVFRVDTVDKTVQLVPANDGKQKDEDEPNTKGNQVNGGNQGNGDDHGQDEESGGGGSEEDDDDDNDSYDDDDDDDGSDNGDEDGDDNDELDATLDGVERLSLGAAIMDLTMLNSLRHERQFMMERFGLRDTDIPADQEIEQLVPPIGALQADETIIADADDDEIVGPEEDQAETTVPRRPGKTTLSRTVNLAHRKDIVAVAVR